MKTLFLIFLSTFLFADSSINVGYSESQVNKKSNKDYSIGMDSSFVFGTFKEVFTSKKVYGSSNDNVTTDYIKMKSLTKYDVNDKNTVYLKLKYYGDNVGSIKDQYTETIGHNYNIKSKDFLFSTKFGVGLIQQTDVNSQLFDTGFVFELPLNEYNKIKSNFDYSKFQKGKSQDFDIGIYTDISKKFTLAVIYDDMVNDSKGKHNTNKSTSINLNIKF